MPSSDFLTILSKSVVYPETQEYSFRNLKLSVSDLPMLSCHYIQKGLLFDNPPLPIDSLLALLKTALKHTLSRFPALAGRLITDSDGSVHIDCNSAGAEFIHANADMICIRDILSPVHVPESVKKFFALDGVVSYDGHFNPLLAVQVTELCDGVFIGCAVNHAVMDGTSFWNFFNTFAELTRGSNMIVKQPDFRRNYFGNSSAVIRFLDGSPKVTFDEYAPIKERIFHFSRESIQKLKLRANSTPPMKKIKIIDEADELMDKENQNPTGNGNRIEKRSKIAVSKIRNNETESIVENIEPTVEISSFQSLCAQLWRSVTRARKLPPSKMATFRMAVNCRQRIEPRVDPLYFGNAIQSIPTVAATGDILSRDLRWCALELNRNVIAHDNAKVRGCVEEWEKNPRCFPLGNLDGASMTMGSSPRFPMYDNDFGWGRPLAIRSGKANKFDGKISAFPGRDEMGSVDLEVCLAPETMAGLELDMEFMQYVS
ncbi:hypothetical protein C5167_047140 [Papaver somniferum]|uniref:Uncharacterized protein n=1 Tax=Papaver somniferum TaxID=3469 RepID=A0A4Y7LFS0_PAPSO|nr:uncharacterized acetyltransferase At3g50280-like [Papaver somniferum]RZC84354.1 hypothetical protein C5167_047140 [Papaver somniferum]